MRVKKKNFLTVVKTFKSIMNFHFFSRVLLCLFILFLSVKPNKNTRILFKVKNTYVMSVPFSKGDFPFFLFQEHGASLLAFINSPKSC